MNKYSSWKLSPGQKQDIILAYISGSAATTLGTQHHVSCQAIYGILRRAHIPIRKSIDPIYYLTPRPHSRCRQLNEAAFDIITEESAYWIGFLMADGCVFLKGAAKHPNLTVALAEVDIGHLYKFRDFLGSTHTITKKTSSGFNKNAKHAIFSIQSRALCNALSKYGIVPRKTARATATGGLENNRHFWRGVVDGDGCLTENEGKARLELVGSSFLVEQFRAYCYEKSGSLAKTRKVKNSTVIQLKATPAKTMIRDLYQEATIALERKQIKAHGILAA